MSKTPFNPELNDPDPVPSYEESIRPGPAAPSRSFMTLSQKLDEVCLSRVRDVLSTYVDPLLVAQGVSGVYKTIFLLVPSNADSLQHPPRDTEYSAYSRPKKPEVVGFSAADSVKLVYLKGEEHTVEFWRQPAVMKELETSLRMQLKMSGHRVEEDSPLAGPSTSAHGSQVDPVLSAKQKKSIGWFGSKSKKSGTSMMGITAPSDATIIDQKLGWRSANEDTTMRKELFKGEMRVHVEWREICLRVENAVGLYDTQKGHGIYLSIEVGS